MENIDTKNNWDWRIYCNNKSCDFNVELKLSNLKTFFDEKFGEEIFESKKDYDINIFSYLYDEIMCGICENFPLTIINNKHEMVLDPDKIISCEQCEKPILLTRLKIKKGTRVTPNNSPKQFKRINAEEFFKLQFKRLNHLITDPRQQEYFKSKYFTFEGKTENIPQDLIDKIK
tara:strand:+ start:612 stop:1133 length:522 start_codon:yes stop_codon:yes gene_type:complete